MKFKLKAKAILGAAAVMIGMFAPTFSANAKNISLHDAVNTGNVEKVRELCSLNVSMVNRPDAYQCYPIHCATTLEVLRCLVEDYGAAVDVKDAMGRTPLHRFMIFVVSGEQEYVEAVNYLLQQGADLHASDKDGVTPLSWLQGIRDKYIQSGGDASLISRLESYCRSLEQSRKIIL